MFQGRQGADHAVFMEAIAPISPGKSGAIHAADFGMASLGGHTGWGEHRVGVVQFFYNLVRVYFRGVIERYQERFGGVQGLQNIHVIGDRRQA